MSTTRAEYRYPFTPTYKQVQALMYCDNCGPNTIQATNILDCGFEYNGHTFTFGEEEIHIGNGRHPQTKILAAVVEHHQGRYTLVISAMYNANTPW